MDRMGGWVTRRHRSILAISAIVTVALLSLVPFIDLNDQWIQYFDHRLTFRGDAEFAIENLTGPYPVEFSVPAAEAEGISDPEYLRNLDAFTGWLRQQPQVTHVYSYADIIKRLNKNLHGDDESWYRIPENRQLAAQYLLLYELSLPFGLDLNDRVSVDKSATRVTATIGDLSTKETRAFLRNAETWLHDNAPSYMHTRPTGASVMFSYISERNIRSMLRGNALALVLISIILMVALRSFGLGLLSLIPNAVPIMVTFGVWALLAGKIGMSAATVTASSLGIVVDDSVHFLAKGKRARSSRRGALRIPYRRGGHRYHNGDSHGGLSGADRVDFQN